MALKLAVDLPGHWSLLNLAATFGSFESLAAHARAHALIRLQVGNWVKVFRAKVKTDVLAADR
jgi:hypothetical protein